MQNGVNHALDYIISEDSMNKNRGQLKSSEGTRMGHRQLNAENAVINKTQLNHQLTINSANCSMADIRSLQKNEHVAQLFSSVIQSQMGTTDRGAQNGMSSRTPKNLNSKSIGKISTGMSLIKHPSRILGTSASRTGRCTLNVTSVLDKHQNNTGD